jgi:hypothetical protein
MLIVDADKHGNNMLDPQENTLLIQKKSSILSFCHISADDSGCWEACNNMLKPQEQAHS